MAKQELMSGKELILDAMSVDQGGYVRSSLVNNVDIGGVRKSRREYP